MRCKICGFRANNIRGMGRHYREKHPSVMRRRVKRIKSMGGKTSPYEPLGQRFCPYCGHEL